MKLKVSNTNQPTWRGLTVKSELPGKLKKLEELSRNLWWVWNSEGKWLFHDLNRDLWRSTGENPVMQLQLMTAAQFEQIMQDKEMLQRIDTVYGHFKQYMDKPMRKDVPSVAYFSMEYGLCNALKIYSGGLGILAGDYIKEASDRCVNMTAVGFLYRCGYFTQTLSMDGQQVAKYEAQNFDMLPIEPVRDANGQQMVLAVPYPTCVVYANVWQVNVGRMKLYLLDTDVDQNSEFDRPITHTLYGGDWENRLKQEYLLGIGGILLLKQLGIECDIYHCNEGHAALLNLQRLVDYVQEKGLSFNEALEVVRASSLYTVHTPVPAGHDMFEEELFGKYTASFAPKLGISWAELMDMGREDPGQGRFSMSVFALNTTQESNGVSWLHGEVSKKMFANVWKGFAPEESHVGYVTNGVHLPTWAASEWKQFYAQHFGPDFMDHQDELDTWKPIFSIPDEEIWNQRMVLKHKFINFVKRDFTAAWLKNQGDPQRIMSIVDKINPNALLIGFARRFATYKRAYLLFSDLDRLAKIVNNEQYPVQFIFAGKAHPHDGPGRDLIHRIVEISKMPQFLGKIIFLENYDMTLSKRLVTGVDVWLNTPTRPLEASGTSGEKAEMNGVLNFSVLDGWWYEGYRENAGWALTDKIAYPEHNDQQDQLDAATIYSMLENEIIPLYFAKNRKGYSPEWVQFIKNSIGLIAPNYTMSRMLHDYISRFYAPQAQRAAHLKAANYKVARQIAQWKEHVDALWDNVNLVGDIEMSDNLRGTLVGNRNVHSAMNIDTAGLINDIAVEMVVYRDVDGVSKFQEAIPLKATSRNGNIVRFELDREVKYSGVFRFAFRIYPWNKELPHRQDFAYMKWV